MLHVSLQLLQRQRDAILEAPVCICRCTVSDASHVERQLRLAAASECGQAVYQMGCGFTLGIAKLRGKGWIASQALAAILYMFDQEVPFPR